MVAYNKSLNRNQKSPSIKESASTTASESSTKGEDSRLSETMFRFVIVMGVTRSWVTRRVVERLP